MRTRWVLPVVVVLGVASCGDNGAQVSDASHDGPELDAQGYPPVPQLGAQIDRMGRPEINGFLNSLFEPNAARKTAKRDAYNHASAPEDWAQTPLEPTVTVVAEFSRSLGAFDAVDTGHPDVAQSGCGNLPKYDGTPVGLGSYADFAALLADDQLYIDTARSQCDRYLALELDAALDIAYTGCGGRTLTHDVIDTSYSLMFAGAAGFSSANAPRIGDGVSAHGDVNNLMFPFLGAPH